jgi:peptide/nickel transport system substrate-binding protein
MKMVLSRKFIYIVLALSLITSLLVFACAAPAPAPTPAPTPTPAPAPTPTPAPTPATPQYGGILKILSIGQTGQFNLGYPSAVLPRFNPLGTSPVIEPLFFWDPNGGIIPHLATGWEWSPDHLKLTITLRKGVKFHDGTDLNAQAVKYNLDLFRLSARAELKTATSIDVVDDYTVRINLKEYDNIQISDLSQVGGATISPTAVQLNGIDYTITHPVGTGPFRFGSYERDVSLKFEKFSDYWQKGKPYLDGIQFIYIADQVTAKAAFLAGEGQSVGDLSPVDAVNLQKQGNYHIAHAPSQFFGLCGDGSHPNSPFADLRVRQAVSYAIDAKTITEAVGYGFFENINQGAFTGIYSFNPDVKGYPYNPQKAKELLTAAGYPNGFKTKIIYATGLSDIASSCLIAQSYLKDVGIDVALEPLTSARFSQVAVEGWQNSLIASQITFSVGYSPLNTLRRNFSARGDNYMSIYHNDAIETKLTQAFIEPDQNKMVSLVKDAQKLMFDDYCVVTPIYSRQSINAQAPSLHDIRMYEPWSSKWTPWDAWLSK